ncbi:MAG: hypothetical protein PHQ05_11925 [Sterolibacterium sp.]|nr:hypothetical protein [Sterolibacterium sp.]
MNRTIATIILHAAAPAKPAVGESCNGCGICCAAEPCPVGMLLLLQFRGRCRALSWQAEHRRYVCGMVTRPAAYLRWLPAGLGSWAGRRLARRIAVGQGCDADIEVAKGGSRR